MTDPTTPDTLTAAAERAETHQEKRQRLATQAADRFVHDHKTIVCRSRWARAWRVVRWRLRRHTPAEWPW